MAGSRPLTRYDVLNFVLVLFLFELTAAVTSLQCKSQQNTPVDWFIAIKVPGKSDLPKDSFFYMDAKSKSWSLSSKTLNDPGQAIQFTLDQIYQKSKNGSKSVEDFMYLMYNDEVPEGFPSKREYITTSTHGHTKGVIGFDSKTGFWLVHSTPNFPPPRDQGYSYPESATTYAQSFLCITMATKSSSLVNIEEIGEQLLYNYPDIYDKNMPAFFGSKFPMMAQAMDGHHVTQQPWYRETSLVSMEGTKFTSFAKYANFDADIYSDWLAPRFQENLLVETWQNGRNKMCSNCTGKYKVYNIYTLGFDSAQVDYKETQDHSKWLVTNSSSSTWTCIGDINRQMSQITRPGGTVCFQDPAVWKNFHDIIRSVHDCKPYNNCVQL